MSQHCSRIGWRERTIVWDLHDLSGFDPRWDCIVDLMHLLMVLGKDLLYATSFVFAKLKVPTRMDLAGYLKTFREMLPACLIHGRRWPRDCQPANICAMSAEEVFNMVRLGWRPMMTEVREGLGANVDLLWLNVLEELCGAWVRYEALVSFFLDRRPATTEQRFNQGVEVTVEYVSFLGESRTRDGQRVFSGGVPHFDIRVLGALASFGEEMGSPEEFLVFQVGEVRGFVD
jgi:hypothetical protein